MHCVNNELNVPSFLNKLRHMVDDPETDDIISWNQHGKSIIIRDERTLCEDLLPLYYKHNNISSFIRQLNMYGFRKLTNVEDELYHEGQFVYQFAHPAFLKGKMELLKDIKRKAPVSKISTPKSVEEPSRLKEVLSDVNVIHNRQNKVDSILSTLKQEHTVLWQELSLLRRRHQKQQQIINKLIQFLLSFAQGGVGGLKRKSFMINDSPPKKQKRNSGPTIHELDSTELNLNGVSSDMTTGGNIQVESPHSTNEDKNACGISKDEIESIEIAAIENEIELLKELDEQEYGTDVSTISIPETFGKNIYNTSLEKQVLVNPSSQDILLSSRINRSYSDNEQFKKDIMEPSNDMSLATCSSNVQNVWKNTVDDIGNHLNITQNELDQIKNYFNGCSSVDATHLLQLLSEIPSYGLPPTVSSDNLDNSAVIAGTEVQPYESPSIDFSELLEDSLDAPESPDLPQLESLDTPDVKDLPPTFS